MLERFSNAAAMRRVDAYAQKFPYEGAIKAENEAQAQAQAIADVAAAARADHTRDIIGATATNAVLTALEAAGCGAPRFGRRASRTADVIRAALTRLVSEPDVAPADQESGAEPVTGKGDDAALDKAADALGEKAP